MKSPLPSGIRPVTTLTRVILIPAAILALLAGIQLYILTDYTDHYFAWTIDQPLSATFLGTGYWAGATLLLFAVAERAWANIRIVIAAVSAFVPLMLLTTLLHLDRFHFNASGTPLVAAWAWMIVYVTVPFALLVLIFFQLRTPGGDPPRTAPLPLLVRIVLAVKAGISLLLSVPLLFFPQVLFSLWPWQLTPLAAQTIGTGLLTVSAASFQLLRENSWRRGRVGAVSYTLIGVLQLLALLRYASTVEWGRPASWLYVLLMVAFVLGGIYTALNTWRLLAPRVQVAKQQPIL